MAYYHDLVVQKSWEELQELRKAIHFVLIGGWATYFYAKTLKSKDIDIIINYDQLPHLEKSYDLIKNDRLKKYEAIKGEVQIDIYLPHYSKIGIPVEDLLQFVHSEEGFNLLDANYLLALKIYTLTQRGRSPKGHKDFLDILSLLHAGRGDLSQCKKILSKYRLLNGLQILKQFLGEFYEVEELGLNRHHFAAIKKKILELL